MTPSATRGSARSTVQRDLVRLALLMCGDRPGAKYSKPVKGVQGSRNDDPYAYAAWQRVDTRGDASASA